ncbi:MAG: hypothetical protein U1F36_12690 [Planctomycetota bacterium]
MGIHVLLGATNLAPAQGPATAKGPPPLDLTKLPDGAVGARDRWFIRGGNAANSGVVFTPAPFARPSVAWTYDSGGKIAGEPLVWDDLVLLEVVGADGRHELHAVELDDGSRRTVSRLNTKIDLEPVLWEHQVVLRRSASELQNLLIGSKMFVEYGRLRAKRADAPLRLGDELYAVVDGHLQRMRVPDFHTVWSSTTADCRGRPVILGDVVYVLHGSDGGSQVLGFARQDGAERGRSDSIPGKTGSSPGELVAGGSRLIVRFAQPVDTDQQIDTLLVDLPLSQRFKPLRGLSLFAPPIVGGDVAVLPIQERAGGHRSLVAGDEFELASAEHHVDVLAVASAMTFADDTLLLGNSAVDWNTRRLRWRNPDLPRSRPVPARETLLYVDGGKLVAARDDSAATTGSTALTREHELLQGKLLQQWVDGAFSAHGLDLVTDLLQRCYLVGVDERWIKEKERMRDTRAKATVRGKPDDAQIAAITAAVAKVENSALDQLWQAHEHDSDPAARAELLRFVLARDPEHAGAVDAVGALLPAPLRPRYEPRSAAASRLASEWLDFATLSNRIGIDFLEPLPDLGKNSADQLMLLQLRDVHNRGWRPDLVALQSPRILIYTPVTHPGSVARCLSAGERVCEVLEPLFADFPKLRENPNRMRILLYGSREEYLAQSRKSGKGASSHLEWTDGHYSPPESLSRMFVPQSRDAFERVMTVFAHELTHQWLMDRCPAVFPATSNSGPDVPGFWVVEGFASLIEQFHIDIETGVCTTDNPLDPHLDVLAHASDDHLLPWDFVLHASQLEMQGLDPKPRDELSVETALFLGGLRRESAATLFYDQSASLCHFLFHAENGRYRRHLLEFVVAFHSGDLAGLDIAKRLGTSDSDLGKRVVDYARRH